MLNVCKCRLNVTHPLLVNLFSMRRRKLLPLFLRVSLPLMCDGEILLFLRGHINVFIHNTFISASVHALFEPEETTNGIREGVLDFVIYKFRQVGWFIVNGDVRIDTFLFTEPVIRFA